MEKYLTLAGGLVFLVQLTVQLIKNLPGLNKIPTDLVTMVLSIGYSELALVMWSQYSNTPVEWYYYVGMFFGGLVVAYIAMYGWNKLKDLWDRSVTNK